MNDKFPVEQKQELLTLYTGFALQGILANAVNSEFGKDTIVKEAVHLASMVVDELELYHMRQAHALANQQQRLPEVQ